MEIIQDTLRNWKMNLDYLRKNFRFRDIIHFISERSNEIGGALIVATVILILIYFGPDILGGE